MVYLKTLYDKRRNLFIIGMINIGVLMFLHQILVLQAEDFLGTTFWGRPSVMILAALSATVCITVVQSHLDVNYRTQRISYQNVDVFRVIFAIIIIILHLRPFLGFSKQLDFVFNNMVSRIAVPFYFLLTGYFLGNKERSTPDSLIPYIKKQIPMYLTWSLLYIPFSLYMGYMYLPEIRGFISKLGIATSYYIPFGFLAIPLALMIILLYTGLYYHLWYFPALLLALYCIDLWKKYWRIEILLWLSGILLLFGAAETYYGVFPAKIQNLLNLYFTYFYTTRNFLFFGLFYVTFGYVIGLRKMIYVKHSAMKLMICSLLLVAEVVLLHPTNRLNSNILLSCVPLVYYLFVTLIYVRPLADRRIALRCRTLSKYYYLVHPAVILVMAQFSWIQALQTGHPFYYVAVTLLFVHIVVLMIIHIEKRRASQE